MLFRSKPGDFISIKDKSKNHPAIIDALELKMNVPAFVEFDRNNMTGKYIRFPERSELNQELNEQSIVEFYNR